MDAEEYIEEEEEQETKKTKAEIEAERRLEREMQAQEAVDESRLSAEHSERIRALEDQKREQENRKFAAEHPKIAKFKSEAPRRTVESLGRVAKSANRGLSSMAKGIASRQREKNATVVSKYGPEDKLVSKTITKVPKQPGSKASYGNFETLRNLTTIGMGGISPLPSTNSNMFNLSGLRSMTPFGNKVQNKPTMSGSYQGDVPEVKADGLTEYQSKVYGAVKEGYVDTHSISDVTGLSTRQVSRALKSLDKKGLIKIGGE